MCLILQIDVNGPFYILHETVQKSVDIAPYSFTYDLLRAKEELLQVIDACSDLKSCIEQHGEYQLEDDYDLNNNITDAMNEYLPTTTNDLPQLLLDDYSLFTDYDSQVNERYYNPSHHLTQTDIHDIFGSDTASSEHDKSSDYAPSTNETSDSDYTDTEEAEADGVNLRREQEQKEAEEQLQACDYADIISEYRLRSKAPKPSKPSFYQESFDGKMYLKQCKPTCNDLCDDMLWLKCDGCIGMMCYDHIDEFYNWIYINSQLKQYNN